MKAAINTLEIALHNLETNEPINRKEGNVEQADAEAANIHEIRKALNVLKLVEYCLAWETVPYWAPIKPSEFVQVDCQKV